MKQNDDIYFTARLGVLFGLILLVFIFLGSIARNEPKPELIRPQIEVQAQEVKEKIIIKQTIPEMIINYSEEYKVDPMLVSCILFNESSYNPEAIGDSGKAKGIAQFHLNTFKTFRKLMGMSQKDLRLNPEESIRTLCWALSTGRGYHWSVYEGCLR